MSKGMGPGKMRGGMPGEKAKDFKGTLKKLIKYMSVYKIQVQVKKRQCFSKPGVSSNDLFPKIRYDIIGVT